MISGRIWDWLDSAAVGASTLCLLHCLALPLVIAALPTLADGLDLGEGFHIATLLFALPISAMALVAGWRRHRAAAPLAVGAGGLLMMGSGLAFGNIAAVETGLTVAGSLLLAGAHIANWRGRRACPVPA